MKLTFTANSRDAWREWFAWRPVIIHTKNKIHLVWLRYVERNGPWEFANIWTYDYRFIQEPDTDVRL
jgi:hypothetical protein